MKSYYKVAKKRQKPIKNTISSRHLLFKEEKLFIKFKLKQQVWERIKYLV